MMASALLAGSPWTAFADTDNILEVLQNSTVRGKVVDASGEPVIGASVVVKGTTTGVITDLDGNFILNNVSEKSILVISYVGYKSQEIAVSGKSAINVTMQEDSEMLDEVVVVGYGAMKKSSLTGSVTVVDSKIFENKGSMSNPLQALQGQAPGVRITRSSSAPGEEGWGVSLRGAVSKKHNRTVAYYRRCSFRRSFRPAISEPFGYRDYELLERCFGSYLWSKSCGWCDYCNNQKTAGR